MLEGTLKVHELLDACSCGSVMGRPHGNRIGSAIVSVVSEEALNRRPQMTAQLIHRAPGRNTWRSKAIQVAAHEDRTRSELVWMRSAGRGPAGVETGADSIRPGPLA
jgi:hypothetical protein